MYRNSLLLPVLACCLLLGTTVEEPKTGETFPESIQSAGETLCCTGTGYRNFMMFRVFALAHYGAPDAMPARETNTAQRWRHWRETTAARALVLRMMRHVGGERFKSGQQDAMDRAGYHGPNREAYIAAFDRSAKKGDEIHVYVPGDDWLVLVWAGEEVGRWQDQALVEAVWGVWLAEDSECSNPEALVERIQDCTNKETE